VYTIHDLRDQLGLSTDHQVRNRIEAIRPTLTDHLKRGPNNQLLIAPSGLEALRRLQELHESGLTLREAAGIVQAYGVHKSTALTPVSYETEQDERSQGVVSSGAGHRPEDGALDALRARVARVEAVLERTASQGEHEPRWWMALWEETDGL
jgi:hypothetical protein